MPRPPRHEDFFEVRFITNYLLAGCTPPSDLIVEFSQEPALDVLMLFLGLDAFDIAQAMFEPKKGRSRNPARHGRKRNRWRGIPDPNDMIGSRMRVEGFVAAAQRLPGYRVAFRLLNAYEGAAFAAAVISGISDIAFNTMWGALAVDPNHCQNLARLSRRSSGTQTMGGAGPAFKPMPLIIQEFNSGFFGSPNITTLNPPGRFGVGFSAWAHRDGAFSDGSGRLQLINQHGDVKGESSLVHIRPGDRVHVSCSATFEPGEQCHWGWWRDGGFMYLDNAHVLAYGEQGWLSWL